MFNHSQKSDGYTYMTISYGSLDLCLRNVL